MGIKLLLMVMGLWMIHPIHVSITDVVHDKERNALEFTTRIFLDDIEKHIQFNTNSPYLDLTDPDEGISPKNLIKEYVMKRLTVQVNGKSCEIDYVGHEIEGDAVNVYYQVLSIKKLKTLTIKNMILTDLYTDQVNMVHIKFEGKLRSMKMTPDQLQATLDFIE